MMYRRETPTAVCERGSRGKARDSCAPDERGKRLKAQRRAGLSGEKPFWMALVMI